MKNNLIFEMLATSAMKFKDKTAVTYKNETYSYTAMLDEIHMLSKHIHELTVTLDHPVGLLFKNCPEFIIGYYGLIKEDIVTMLIDHKLKGDELQALVNDCHLGGFLLHRDELEHFALKDKFDCVLEYKNFALLYKTDHQYNRPYNQAELMAVTSCRFSSGTTGGPKCMMYAEDNIIAAATNWKNTIHLNEQDKILCLANYTHGLAFNTSMLSPLSVGAEIHMLDSLMPRAIAKYIEQKRITKLVAFPVLYQIMAEKI